MSFCIYVDGSSNLPGRILDQRKIRVLPCSYTVDGVQGSYDGSLDSFDYHDYYDRLRAGGRVQTSLLNAQLFTDSFRPVLAEGRDILYFSMSAGISGTCQAARMAASELLEEFPGRVVRVVDSKGAGFGTGLMAVRAADLRELGWTVSDAADYMDIYADSMLQFFTVDDLNFLKRTGRVSGATAMIGTVLNIKPILWGDGSGHITARSKVRGRKKALEALAEEYRNTVTEAESQIVAISHGDCEEEALKLAEMIRGIARPADLIIAPHEPFTGAHVGPGMLAVFYHGKNRTDT